jgi:hypothetical protein
LDLLFSLSQYREFMSLRIAHGAENTFLIAENDGLDEQTVTWYAGAAAGICRDRDDRSVEIDQNEAEKAYLSELNDRD